MSENSDRDIAKRIEEINSCTDVKQLVAGIAEGLVVTIESVRLVAARILRLKELGHEITIEIPQIGPLLGYYRSIAEGQLSPELLVACCGRMSLLRKAGTLPMSDQVKIANNEPVRVMQIGGEHRMVPALQLTNLEVSQVFGDRQVRSDAEQIGWLKDRATREVMKRQATSDDDVTLDSRSRTARIGTHVFTIAQLSRMIEKLSGG